MTDFDSVAVRRGSSSLPTVVRWVDNFVSHGRVVEACCKAKSRNRFKSSYSKKIDESTEVVIGLFL